MIPEVVLKCVHGKLAGKIFSYKERSTCVLGRSPDCDPQLPDDKDHSFISRHHCMLDINPPEIRVRDFGSLNGTFVNGRMIGQREQSESGSSSEQSSYREINLKDRDKLQVGESVFEVHIRASQGCSSCNRELTEAEVSRSVGSPGFAFCNNCIESIDLGELPAEEMDATVTCASCAAHVSRDITRDRSGEILCEACRTDPKAIFANAKHAAPGSDTAFKGIEGYEIGEKLGAGGMGAVYLATHAETSQEIALKLMLPEVAANERAVRMFQREIENARALNHPNLVRLLDAGYTNGSFFLCLEFCKGGSVFDFMRERGGTLDIEEAAHVTFQILDALEYAHSLIRPDAEGTASGRPRKSGYVHRDIKPKNVLLADEGSVQNVKVADFGLAKAFDMAGLSGLTRTGETCGSPHYVCRQQVINFKYSKPEVDLWATAATFYTMVTGEYPRDFSKAKDLWQTVLEESPVPIRKRRPSIPRRLANFVDHALKDKPKIAYQSAQEFRRDFERAL